MYKLSCSMILLAALAALPGCGQSADSLVQRQIDQMNEFADAVEAGKDEAEIEAIGKRLQETKETLENLDLSDEEKRKLAEKHGEELGKAMGRMMTVMMSRMGKEMKKAAPMMEGMMKGIQEGMRE